MMKTEIKGFTLIELLIVVAIIAILAAIAIPNFLEAQVRAKVSRSMADMRSIGIAIDAYHIDNAAYPNFVGGPRAGDYIGYLMVENSRARYAGQLLTTPIPYLSSIPLDVFMTKMLRQSAWGGPLARFYSVVATISNNGPRDYLGGWELIGRDPEYFHWFMESCGPDLTWWVAYPLSGRDLHRFFYDPTNGTVSQGQLVLSDKGWVAPRK